MAGVIALQFSRVRRKDSADSIKTGSLSFILDTHLKVAIFSYYILLVSNLTISLNLLWPRVYVTSPSSYLLLWALIIASVFSNKARCSASSSAKYHLPYFAYHTIDGRTLC